MNEAKIKLEIKLSTATAAHFAIGQTVLSLTRQIEALQSILEETRGEQADALHEVDAALRELKNY